jgi:hypothetical protein
MIYDFRFMIERGVVCDIRSGVNE